MLTGTQIRIARSALRWSAEKLADKSKVASKTIRRIEAADSVPNSTLQVMQRIQDVLEDAGIEFIGTPDDAPGIRIHGDSKKT